MKKPARRPYLTALGRLQDLIGKADMWFGNDRDPHGFAKGRSALKEAFAICVNMRSGLPLPMPRDHEKVV